MATAYMTVNVQNNHDLIKNQVHFLLFVVPASCVDRAWEKISDEQTLVDLDFIWEGEEDDDEL